MTINFTNITEPIEFISAPNDVNSYFWTVILYLIVTIAFLISSVYGFFEGLLVASFIGVLLGLLLLYLGVIGYLYFGILIGLLIISMLGIAYDRKQ